MRNKRYNVNYVVNQEKTSLTIRSTSSIEALLKVLKQLGSTIPDRISCSPMLAN